jgi:ubiquinone biosynthesis monooxygenase Coq7
MTIAARLKRGETLGDRILKVDHAGEHGAVCIYRAQRLVARWRAPDMIDEIDEFLVHERNHRARFGRELSRRGIARCRSYWLCGSGGALLGLLTGLAGRSAMAATTVAIESVVLRHMHEQVAELGTSDPAATAALRDIVAEEQAHHDAGLARLSARGLWRRLIEPIVSVSTETVIWLGMRL